MKCENVNIITVFMWMFKSLICKTVMSDRKKDNFKQTTAEDRSNKDVCIKQSCGQWVVASVSSRSTRTLRLHHRVWLL